MCSLTLGGGTEIWIIEASKRLARHYQISIVGLTYADKRRLTFDKIISLLNKDRVNYYEYPFIKLPRGVPIPNPLCMDRLLGLFSSCDITYIIMPKSPIEVIFYLLKKISKINMRSKFIAGFHGFLRSDILLQRLYIPIFKKTLSAFEAYHVLNKETYYWLKKEGFNNIFYIPNGINTKIYQLCGKPSNSTLFNVLFTGRLTKDKGTDILVEIIRYVNENLKLRDIRFTITGSGPLEDKIKVIAHDYTNVDYLGFVDAKVLPKIYAKANLFLITSRSEGMPLRLLEAQSCGLPVVGSRIPGVADVVINGKTGCLVNVGDVKGFAEAIKKYYELWRSSPKEYYNMNKAIRQYIVNNYDWKTVIERLKAMFRLVINESHRGGNLC